MKINEYVILINRKYSTGKATEHSYREILTNLIQGEFSDIEAINEPKREKCGAPDYVISKKGIPIGYIEAKNVDKNLNQIEQSKSDDQIKRYREALDNLILTNYLEFYFYRYGERVQSIQIAELVYGKIKPIPKNFSLFESLLTAFIDFQGETIKSSQVLAVMMAHKAQLMKDIFYRTLITENKEDKNTINTQSEETTSLRGQLEAFKKILMHDLNEKRFADIYAQTISYGLFASRFNMDKEADEPFSRKTAGYYVPRSNPFLRRFFGYIAGPELDERVTWIVDDLANIFRYTNVDHIREDFNTVKSKDEPMIHFYETFLAEYDSALRKKRGVYYTPDSVVNFMVRAVDDILQTEFKLPQGLADTSKVSIPLKDSKDENKELQKEVHKVQILDPATGTGTFLAETIKQIHVKFKGQQGTWNSYVEEHLKPRLHGFEILMASYAMCHLKLDLLLQSTGYTKSDNMRRFGVYLTNSLEESELYEGDMFANWLTHEANEANRIKEDVPVMVVMGNPPYSVSSLNKGNWIQNKIDDYKKDLQEKNIQSLSDDYIKFIRFAEHFIEKNRQGVLAMITNNSFYDGVTHRQMRKHLLETF